MFRFVVDRIVKNRAYPALQQWPAEPYTREWREFGQHSPYTVPCDLIDHCETHGMPYELITVAEYENNIAEYSKEWVFYPVQFGFFSFDTDYIALLPPEVAALACHQQLCVLFYYHEGDDPAKIIDQLNQLLKQNDRNDLNYLLVSGNTKSEEKPWSSHEADHEFLYYKRNINVRAEPILTVPKQQDFTLLSRTHKWWRAAVVSDLHSQNLLTNSIWSYNTDITVDDHLKDCPIELDRLNLIPTVRTFLDGGPYSCDLLTAADHNDHSLHVSNHYSSSYCSIILETLFDADSSGGTFLTEKTFKCLKHGHPFVLFAPPGSLQLLRDLGYRTFDSAIDNRYDLVEDNTQRYQAAVRTVAQLKSQDLYAWHLSLIPDLEHNQQLFCSTKRDRLNRLYDKLLHKLATLGRSHSR
jgi:hypothetical protein